MQDSLTHLLSRHLDRPVAPQVRLRARLHLLDWLGCVAGALSSEAGAIARRMPGPTSERVAWLGNKLEMDDVHRMAILHPGPVIWPAVLTAAGSDMDSMLDAAVRGYEAMIAVGTTFDARHYAFWHNTATAGVFGAAVAALDCAETGPVDVSGWPNRADRLRDVLGLAGSIAGGLWQMRHEPCDAKQWHISHAVTTGLHAARSVLAGARGPAFILEGPQGLQAATMAAPNPLDLPEHWRIEGVSFKPWAACRHAHPAIDAALELKERIGRLDGPITVETYADALTFCDRPNPTSEIEAKFSIQHSVALVADSGVPQLADFTLAAIAATADTRARITVVEGRDFTSRYPAHFGAKVRCGDQEVTLVDTLGDPERPVAEAELLSKAKALFALTDHCQDFEFAADAVLQGNSPATLIGILDNWLQ